MKHHIFMAVLQTIKASIMVKNNALISVLLEENFKMEMIFSQRSKESPKTSEGLPVSLPVAIPETLHNTEVVGRMDSRV